MPYIEAPFVRLVEEQPFTRVKAFTIGYVRELKAINSFLKPAIGGQWMAHGIPSNVVNVFSANPPRNAILSAGPHRARETLDPRHCEYN